MKTAVTVLSLILTISISSFAHCEIPCGIYGDKMRFQMIREDIETIQKSMKSIKKLEQEKPINYNQLVRWIENKDNHADKIMYIVTQYFMTQRITPDTSNYDKKISALHQMLIYSMKAKQTLDLENCTKLLDLTHDFEHLYFTKDKK